MHSLDVAASRTFIIECSWGFNAVAIVRRIRKKYITKKVSETVSLRYISIHDEKDTRRRRRRRKRRRSSLEHSVSK